MRQKEPTYRVRLITILLILAVGFFARTTSATDFVIGIPPFLTPADQTTVKNAVYLMLLEKTPINSRITVFDAYNLQQVTDLKIPDRSAYSSARVRRNLAERNLVEINRFFTDRVTPPDDDEHPNTGIKVPQFLELLASSRANLSQMTIILLGSPLYVDPREPRLSMKNSFMPTDNHLCVSQVQSVYGTANRRGRLAGARVHQGYLGDPWLNDLHELRARQFWSLFIKETGGLLVTFTGDLSTLLERMQSPDLGDPWSFRLECQPPGQPQMVSVLPSGSWADPRHPTSKGIPCATREKMSIGILWDCTGCDLDLYSRPAATGSELSYKNIKNDAGIHYKDFKTLPNPSHGFEWIEYHSPVALSDLKAAVNFFGGGSAKKVEGEVRIKVDDKVYGGGFEIEALTGNQGADGDSREKSKHWTVLDLPTLLGCVDGRLAGKDATTGGTTPSQGYEQPAPSGQPRPQNQPGIDAGGKRGKEVRILSPRDGAVLRAPRGHSTVYGHMVSGDVVGYDRKKIEELGLTVEVIIYTTGAYPQGIAAVRVEGDWELPAHFGGSRHIVRAILRDASGDAVDTDEVNVTLIHE